MNHTKPINKEFLEDDSNFYTAFTQYNLDEIWKSERELKYMIKVLFVCHGTTLPKFWKTLILQYIFEPVGMFY